MIRLDCLLNLSFCLAMLLASSAECSVYQWSVPIAPPATQSATSQPSADVSPRAYLWIPPNCQRIRGVVVGQHNMLEEDILDHPIFRDAMSKLDLAIIWITPAMDGQFIPARSGDRFLKMLADLAQQSGCAELQFAPVAPIGHSAAASYPWNFAAWMPQRTLGVLSIHGDAPDTPYAGFGKPNLPWGDHNVDGVPGFFSVGEFEWTDARWAPATTYRVAHPLAPIAFLAEPGEGHFFPCDDLVRFCAMFLRKCVEQRLPPLDQTPTDRPPPLTPIDPKQGWLTERWTLHQPHMIPPAAFADYGGDHADAFWTFDEEMADAIHSYHADRIGKKAQLIGFTQNGKPVAARPSLGMVQFAFSPNDDGETFEIGTRFLETVESMGDGNNLPRINNLMRVSRLPAGSPIGHATGGGPIVLHRIEGPIEQTSASTFKLSFNRGYSPREAIWICATHPGDEQYNSAVQQATMPVRRNTEGTAQMITAEPIADQSAGVQSIKLRATSTANLPVHFYVREGPAEVNGDVLSFTSIPPRSVFPIPVTVVAWQWGRGTEPLVQTADMVELHFQITQ